MTGGIAARLAHAMGRRDEEPNILLAEELARKKDAGGISQIAEIAASGSTAAQNDAIKVLYEVGARDPALLRSHIPLLLEKMHSRNNRMVWGALTALAEVSKTDAKPVAAHLESILAAADAGSVIAKDQAMQILIVLLAKPRHARVAVRKLLERLETAAVNQLPMYAERVVAALDARDHPQFLELLSRRLKDDLPQSKRRRIEKVIKKLG